MGNATAQPDTPTAPPGRRDETPEQQYDRLQRDMAATAAAEECARQQLRDAETGYYAAKEASAKAVRAYHRVANRMQRQAKKLGRAR